MGIARHHLMDSSVHQEKIKDDAVTKPKISDKALQAGRTSVTFGFSIAGEENVSASITFPTAFDAAPAVSVMIEGINVGITSVSVTASGFTVTVRDDKGTDYTTSQSATVNWIAVAV